MSDAGELLINLCRLSNKQEADKELNAAKLVKEWLTKEEWDMLIQHGYVHIQSKINKKRYYIVFEDPDKKVKVIHRNKVGKAGIINEKNKTKEYHDVIKHEQIMELCGIVVKTDKYSRDQFTDWDKMLTKIMAIKSDEDYYLENSQRYL